jgi:hypothetical protein
MTLKAFFITPPQPPLPLAVRRWAAHWRTSAGSSISERRWLARPSSPNYDPLLDILVHHGLGQDGNFEREMLGETAIYVLTRS